MQEDMTPTIGESFRDRIRRARQEKASSEPISVPIPGCECKWETDDKKWHTGHLEASYNPVGYEEARAMNGQGNDALAEKEAAAKFLVAACSGINAVEDGKATPLPGVRMGRSFAEYLGVDLDGIDNDVQAIFAIFPGNEDLKLMTHFGLVCKEMGLVDDRVLEELRGNF